MKRKITLSKTHFTVFALFSINFNSISRAVGGDVFIDFLSSNSAINHNGEHLEKSLQEKNSQVRFWITHEEISQKQALGTKCKVKND